MSRVPDLSVCVCVYVHLCVNPNKGYPIQDKIRPARPYTADGAEAAKKSPGWCKPTVGVREREERKQDRS